MKILCIFVLIAVLCGGIPNGVLNAAGASAGTDWVMILEITASSDENENIIFAAMAFFIADYELRINKFELVKVSMLIESDDPLSARIAEDANGFFSDPDKGDWKTVYLQSKTNQIIIDLYFDFGENSFTPEAAARYLAAFARGLVSEVFCLQIKNQTRPFFSPLADETDANIKTIKILRKERG